MCLSFWRTLEWTCETKPQFCIHESGNEDAKYAVWLKIHEEIRDTIQITSDTEYVMYSNENFPFFESFNVLNE